MKKWEYTHRSWDYYSGEAIERAIKELGNNGWRLVKVISCGYDNVRIMAFFERENKEGPFTVPPRCVDPELNDDICGNRQSKGH